MPLASPIRRRPLRRASWVRAAAALCLLAGGASGRAEEAAALEAPEGLRSKLANWSELSVDERRTVLTALHRRMAEAGLEGKLQVRSERRFGYRVERPDGTVVRIERRQAVVQFRDAEGQSFGVGFEQRLARPEQHPPEQNRPRSEQASLGEVAPSPSGWVVLPLEDRLEDLPVALGQGDTQRP
jgi:hypothetical protein